MKYQRPTMKTLLALSLLAGLSSCVTWEETLTEVGPVVAAVLIGAAVGYAASQGGGGGYSSYSSDNSSYDPQSGNRYEWEQDATGETTVLGSNDYTGSRWRTVIDRDGSMHGVDADGNQWRYNRDTGHYINYGTGQQCFGKGPLRTCT